MYIKNSLTENFGDFKLDTNAIGMYSKSTQDIMLPYNGNLPEKMSPASDAFIHVNVSPTRGASISLSVNANGKKIRRPIEASNQEIIDLLERYNVRTCCYGHLHGPSHRLAVEGMQGMVDYQLVSADFVGFRPKKILD